MFVIAVTSRKHLRSKVTPSLHLTVKWGKPGVGTDKHNIGLFVNLFLLIVEKYPIVCLFVCEFCGGKKINKI